MLLRFQSNCYGISIRFLIFSIFLSCFSGLISSEVVTLDSIEIYNTHEWLKGTKPTVYFKCKGENKIVLPDVKEKHTVYTFKGEESWQPLTELPYKKCKRCGFYEEDSIKSDDVYEEWELCHSDFTEFNGKYVRIKDKEFKAVFSCPQCKLPIPPPGSEPKHRSRHRKGWSLIKILLVVMGSIVGSTVLIVGAVAAYKYWQKRKREQDQARFLKLFEDGDDVESELGLGDII